MPERTNRRPTSPSTSATTLLRDPDVGELDVHVVVDGDRVVVTGHVSTQDRRDAISRVLAELLPGQRRPQRDDGRGLPRATRGTPA